MKKGDLNKIHVGANSDYIAHERPILAESLLSINPGATPTVTKMKAPRTSEDVKQVPLRLGAKVETLDLRIYNSSVFGKARRNDNSDLLLGYEPLFGDMKHFKEVYQLAADHRSQLESFFSPNIDSSVVARMEMPEIQKLTVQRVKPIGWHLEPIMVPYLKMTRYPERFEQIVKDVLLRYKAAIPDILRLSKTQIRMNDYDPSETMVGLPTLAKGPEAHAARILTLRALEPLPPADMAKSYRRLASQLGLPENLLYSSMLSTRAGAIRPTKSQDLWYLVGPGQGFRADYSSTSIYMRVRHVMPAPQSVNLIMSPVYVACSNARKRILGLWHTPELKAKYVPLLRAQGKVPQDTDFTAMDKHMSPVFLKLVFDTMVAIDFLPDEAKFMLSLIDDMGVVHPSFEGNPNQVTFIHGVLTMLSGIKLTSELDSIFNIACNMYGMERFIPNIFTDWLRGRFIFLVQGDDGHTILPKEIDSAKFTELMMNELGVDIKIDNTAMFLKEMVPDHSEVKAYSRPFGRVLQQRVYNEDRLSGIEGGDKPDALLRLAAKAGYTGLEAHPSYRTLVPKVLIPVIMELDYVRRASPTYQRKAAKGIFDLDHGDEAKILEYASRNPDFIAERVEAAKYQNSAALMVEMLKKVGVSPAPALSSWMAQRKDYIAALEHKPTLKDVATLKSFVPFLK